MDSKARILKMLEDGLITTKEAIDLMNALNEDDQDKKHTNDKKEEDNSIYKFFENVTDEVGKILDPDTIQKNAKETFDDVRRKAKATKSTSDILKTLEDVFDKAKTGDIDAIFQQGSKNKLIETIEEDFSSVTLDVTNGNVEVKKTDGVTAVRFEVTPFYRKLDKKRNYFEDIFCEVKNGNLEIMSPLRSAKVNVVLEINERALDYLHISSSNGSVEIEDLLLKDLSIDILNGDIEVDDISAKHAFVRTSRGSLEIKESAFTNLELVSML